MTILTSFFAFAAEVSAVAGGSAAAAESSFGEWVRDNSGALLKSMLIFVVALACGYLLSRLLLFFSRRSAAAGGSSPSLRGRLLGTTAVPLGILTALAGSYFSYSLVPVYHHGAALAMTQFFRTGLALLCAFLLHIFITLLFGLSRFSAAPALQRNALAIGLFRKLAVSLLWAGAVFFIMQHVLGLNVGSLIAAAGVAGLVIAFAAQNTVSNLFGALSLVMDKPFKEGDRISCNGADGIVEFMGLRASRIRSLEGQEIIIPNHILADNQLINYSDRQHFRHIFNIRLGYGTPPERIEEAVRILHEILDNREMTVPGRHPIIAFNEMQEWAFNISAFVWYDTTDWAAYQADLHLVNLEILRRFRAAGITFAIPASVNYLMGDEKQTAPKP